MSARGPRYFARLSGDVYYDGAPCKSGHTKRRVKDACCVFCGAKRRGKSSPEKARARSLRWSRKQPAAKKADAVRQWRMTWSEEKIAHVRERAKLKARIWRRMNPGHRNALAYKYKADKLRRIPAWANLNAIREFYERCPPGYHVDHIIPMRGLTVSGLHVHTNLQYLPAVENLRKNRRYEDCISTLRAR